MKLLSWVTLSETAPLDTSLSMSALITAVARLIADPVWSSRESKPVPPLVWTVTAIVQEIVVGVAMLLVPVIVPPGQRANKP